MPFLLLRLVVEDVLKPEYAFDLQYAYDFSNILGHGTAAVMESALGLVVSCTELAISSSVGLESGLIESCIR